MGEAREADGKGRREMAEFGKKNRGNEDGK